MVADNETLDEEDDKYIDDVSSIAMYTPKARGTGNEVDPEQHFTNKFESPEPAVEYPHDQVGGFGGRVGMQKEMGQNSSQTNQRDIKVFDNVRFKNDILEVRKQQNAQEYGYIFNEDDDKLTAAAQPKSLGPHNGPGAEGSKHQPFSQDASSVRVLNNMSENLVANSAHAGPMSMPHKVQTVEGEKEPVAIKSVFANRRLSNQPVSSLHPRIQNIPRADTLETDLFNEHMMKVNPEWNNLTEHNLVNAKMVGGGSNSSSNQSPKTDNNTPSLRGPQSAARANTYASKPSLEFMKDELREQSMDYRQDIPDLDKQRTNPVTVTPDYQDFLDKETPNDQVLVAREIDPPRQKQYKQVQLLPEPI